jgi:DNA-binding transcriptional LysR family regulator
MNKNRDLPALDLLKAFEAAARLLSFTRAGAELFLSQSAVSRQIQQLESQLGVPLFIRRTRALLLTEAGQRYYRDVSQALHQLQEAGRRLRQPSESRVVTVTTAMTFASLWLVPRLADFQQRQPQIEVRVAADNTLRDLDRDRLDLGIRYSTREQAGAGALHLFGERVLPVCSPALLQRQRPRVPADLVRYTLLHFEDPDQLTPWLTWRAWFEAVGARMPQGGGVIRYSHYDMVLRAAVSGQGIALGRLPLIQDLLDEGALVAPLAGAGHSAGSRGRAYWLMVSTQARARPEVRTFIDWLQRQAPRAAQEG